MKEPSEQQPRLLPRFRRLSLLFRSTAVAFRSRAAVDKRSRIRRIVKDVAEAGGRRSLPLDIPELIAARELPSVAPKMNHYLIGGLFFQHGLKDEGDPLLHGAVWMLHDLARVEPY